MKEYSTTVGVSQLKAENESAVVFDLMGRKQNGTTKGLNVIKKDGKAMKVMR